MPSYKLIYFPGRGRAEPLRLVFAAAKVEYEDCRIAGEQFGKLKASGTLPFGQLPILEIDGKILAQSIAILKYVARETGFAPDDNFETAKADMVLDCLADLFEKRVRYYFLEQDQEKKKILEKEFLENHLPTSLGYLEKLIQSNNSAYFAASKLTYADITFFAHLDGYFFTRKEDVPPVLNDYPGLKDVFNNVRCNPGIKEWLKSRPKTDI